MTFTVKYRAGDGAMREERIEAANRGECIAKCKAHGIAPVSVREYIATGHSVALRFHISSKCLFWCCGLLLLGAVAYILTGNSIPELPENKARLGEKQSNPPKRAVRTDSNPVGIKSCTNSTKEAERSVNKRIYLGSEVLRSEFTTNGNIIIERLFTADGKRHRINHMPPSVFKNASDEYLAIFLSTPPGAPMVPFPDLSHDGGIEKAFLESLNDEIMIDPNDSPSTKDIKAKVIAAREAMDAMMKQGLTFVAALENERLLHNENQTIHAQVRAEYAALIRNADLEAAEQYRLKVNEALKNLGIEEIQRKYPRDNKKQGDSP
jgi:hypothetical protein